MGACASRLPQSDCDLLALHRGGRSGYLRGAPHLHHLFSQHGAHLPCGYHRILGVDGAPLDIKPSMAPWCEIQACAIWWDRSSLCPSASMESCGLCDTFVTTIPHRIPKDSTPISTIPLSFGWRRIRSVVGTTASNTSTLRSCTLSAFCIRASWMTCAQRFARPRRFPLIDGGVSTSVSVIERLCLGSSGSDSR